MRHSWLPSSCKIALLIAATAIGFAPHANAATNICPQFLTKYCVLTPAGHRETVETNPCFAREQHMRILHIGSCTTAGTICPQILMQYCVLTAAGHRETVETNSCFARRQHMRILHSGHC